MRARRLDDRCRPFGVGRGKSGLHGKTVPGNTRRGRPQGKCHRKETARASAWVRLKGCGKSAPHRRQRRWQDKPHREQDQIEVVRRVRSAGSVPGPVTWVGCLRRPVTGVPEEWSSPERGQNPAYRPPGAFTFKLTGTKSEQVLDGLVHGVTE